MSAGLVGWTGYRLPSCSRQSTCHKNIGRALQRRFTLLIAQQNSGENNTSIGFRFGQTHLQNGGFKLKLIVRTYGVRQLQLVPIQSCKNMESWPKLGGQQNENGEGMRDARSKAHEKRE